MNEELDIHEAVSAHVRAFLVTSLATQYEYEMRNGGKMCRGAASLRWVHRISEVPSQRSLRYRIVHSSIREVQPQLAAAE